MRRVLFMVAAVLVLLGGASPAAGASTPKHATEGAYAPKRATVAEGSPIMVEGRVLSETSTELLIVTPPTSSGCRPPMMCPDFLIAPMRYEVQTSGAAYFGPYIGGPRVGDEVVVYGTLVRAATGQGGAEPIAASFGVISAQGILIVSAAPYLKQPLPMHSSGTTQSGSATP